MKLEFKVLLKRIGLKLIFMTVFWRAQVSKKSILILNYLILLAKIKMKFFTESETKYLLPKFSKLPDLNTKPNWFFSVSLFYLVNWSSSQILLLKSLKSVTLSVHSLKCLVSILWGEYFWVHSVDITWYKTPAIKCSCFKLVHPH